MEAWVAESSPVTSESAKQLPILLILHTPGVMIGALSGCAVGTGCIAIDVDWRGNHLVHKIDHNWEFFKDIPKDLLYVFINSQAFLTYVYLCSNCYDTHKYIKDLSPPTKYFEDSGS